MTFPIQWKVIKFHGSKPPIRYHDDDCEQVQRWGRSSRYDTACWCIMVQWSWSNGITVVPPHSLAAQWPDGWLSDPSAWLSDPILLAHFRSPTKIHENQILDPTLQVTPSPSSTRISQLSRSTSSSKKQPAMSSRLPRVWFLPCASLKIQHEASPYGGFLKLGTPKWMVYTGKSSRSYQQSKTACTKLPAQGYVD